MALFRESLQKNLATPTPAVSSQSPTPEAARGTVLYNISLHDKAPAVKAGAFLLLWTLSIHPQKAPYLRVAGRLQGR